MKKYLFFLAVFMVIIILVSCSFDPIVTTYGESVHEAVKEHYEAYEILGLVRLEEEGKPTLQNFCIINDRQGNMDILCISYALSEENRDDYIATSTVLNDDIEIGKYYSSETVLQNTVVKYTVCKKDDVPDSVLQKEKIRFDGQELYFGIVELSKKAYQ